MGETVTIGEMPIYALLCPYVMLVRKFFLKGLSMDFARYKVMPSLAMLALTFMSPWNP